MKHLKFLSLMFLPVLSSCNVVQEDYYSPPPRVQVEQYFAAPNYHSHPSNRRYYNNNRHLHRQNNGGVYHGHSDDSGNVVTVNPDQRHGMQAQNNVHEHGANNLHGHR